MIQHDDTIGDVFLQAIAGQCGLARLAGDDGRHPFVFQPAKKPAQFGAQDGRVGKSTKERADGIQRQPLGADRINRQPEPNEQPFEVILARLFDLAAFDVHVVDEHLLLFDEFLQVPTQRGHVLYQFLVAFLE